MARGDVVAYCDQLAASSAQDIRPASGVEWVIKAFGGDLNGWVYLYGTNGSDNAIFVEGALAKVYGGTCTIPINNTNYVKISNNNSGGVGNYFVSGYITKD